MDLLAAARTVEYAHRTGENVATLDLTTEALPSLDVAVRRLKEYEEAHGMRPTIIRADQGLRDCFAPFEFDTTSRPSAARCYDIQGVPIVFDG